LKGFLCVEGGEMIICVDGMKADAEMAKNFKYKKQRIKIKDRGETLKRILGLVRVLGA
jgi:hypothetical protein